MFRDGIFLKSRLAIFTKFLFVYDCSLAKQVVNFFLFHYVFKNIVPSHYLKKKLYHDFFFLKVEVSISSF